MKNIFKINSIFFLFVLLLFAACDREQDDLVTENAQIGGLVDLLNPSVSYAIGSSDPINLELLVYQGAVTTTKIDIYKQFTDATGTSNRALLTTLTDLPAQTGIVSFQVDGTSLREGLTRADGTAIPAEDTDLNIGDSWKLIVESTTSEGNVFQQASPIAITVSTRFAGTYVVIESDYWRIGVQSGAADWTGDERIIQSVDAITYYHADFGPLTIGDFGADASFHFTIDGDLNIDVLEEYNGAVVPGLGTYMISCESNPNDMVNVPCTDTNYAQLSEDGKDILVMTYGYFTEGSGPREFYEVLQKK